MLITGKEDFFQNKLLVDNFKFYYYYQGVSRSLTLTGRRPVPSPRAAAVGSQAAKRAYKLAFLPPRPQRLPPLRAFHLSASRSQPARIKHLMKRFKVERKPRRGDMIVAKGQAQS
jgi:hypothetical protein